MPAWVAPLIGAAGSIAGSALSGMMSQGAADSAFQQSKEGQWQQYRLNRGLRRTVTEDLKAAGLNPILAASGGFNVGNTTVSAPHGYQAQIPDYGAQFGSSAQSLAEAFKVGDEREKIKAETYKIREQVAEIRQTVSLKIKQGITEIKKQGNLDADTAKKFYEIKNLTAVFDKTYQEIDTMRNKIEQLKADVNFKNQGAARLEADKKRINQETKNLVTIGKQLKHQLSQFENDDRLKSTGFGELINVVDKVMRAVSPFIK